MHGIFVGQFSLDPSDDPDRPTGVMHGWGLPQVVVTVVPPSAEEIDRRGDKAPVFCQKMPLEEFCGVAGVGVSVGAGREQSGGGGDVAPLAASRTCPRKEEEEEAPEVLVRLYLNRPLKRLETVARALSLSGRVCGDAQAFEAGCREDFCWWALFDEAESFQPGLCATKRRAKRYRVIQAAAPVRSALMLSLNRGTVVARRGRVLLRGAKLARALRVSKAAASGWTSLGGFFGQSLASMLLDDGDAATAAMTATGGWAGGLAGTSVATMCGAEALGFGSLTGGLMVSASIGCAGALAGAGVAYGLRRTLDTGDGKTDRSTSYHEGALRLLLPGRSATSSSDSPSLGPSFSDDRPPPVGCPGNAASHQRAPDQENPVCQKAAVEYDDLSLEGRKKIGDKEEDEGSDGSSEPLPPGEPREGEGDNTWGRRRGTDGRRLLERYISPSCTSSGVGPTPAAAQRRLEAGPQLPPGVTLEYADLSLEAFPGLEEGKVPRLVAVGCYAVPVGVEELKCEG